jgi:maleylacetate reductase
VNHFVYDALPGRIVFGAGRVGDVPSEAEALGLGRVLVIADEAAKEIAERIADGLGPRCAGTFVGVRQHVPEDLAEEARAEARQHRADGVITVGGGSATGLGKAVVVETGQPLVAVPTTYAGSEMTPIYGLTGKHKVTGRDLKALPRVVVYDPELTLSLPLEVAVPSGFNAVAHCVEALYATNANPVTSLMAEEGIRAMARALGALARRPGDREARSDALYGAYLAGAALGVTGVALHHRVCHVLGGSFGLVHGEVNAVMLPHVVAYNAPAAPQAMARVAAALGAPAQADRAAGALADLAETIGAPTSLAAIGMPADGLEAAAERTVAEVGPSNPRLVDRSSLLALLQAAYDGTRP